MGALFAVIFTSFDVEFTTTKSCDQWKNLQICPLGELGVLA
jgi:hypothetical protein